MERELAREWDIDDDPNTPEVNWAVVALRTFVQNLQMHKWKLKRQEQRRLEPLVPNMQEFQQEIFGRISFQLSENNQNHTTWPSHANKVFVKEPRIEIYLLVEILNLLRAEHSLAWGHSGHCSWSGDASRRPGSGWRGTWWSSPRAGTVHWTESSPACLLHTAVIGYTHWHNDTWIGRE